MTYPSKNSKESLIKTSYAYLKTYNQWYIYIATYIVYIGCGMIIDLIMALMVSQSTMSYFGYYIILTFIHKCLSYVTKSFEISIENTISKNFIRDNYNMYDRMTFTSKNKLSVHDFRQKMNDARWPINSIIVWGLPEVIESVTTIISFIIILISVKQYMLGGIIFVLNCLAGMFLIRPLQKKISEFRKTFRKKIQKLNSIIRSNLEMFQNKHKSVNDMLKDEFSIADINCEQYWYYISFIVGITNALPLIYCYYYMTNINQLLIIIQFSGHLKSVVSSLTGFMNQYGKLDADYASGFNMWQNATFGDIPENLDIPDQLIIQDVCVERKNFVLKLDRLLPNITINKGDKILIQGSSGHGKSTFLNALTGKIPGIILDKGMPENYYHSVSEFYQGLVGNLPVTDVSIRFLFDNESDDNLIKTCMKLCYIDNILDTLSTNSSIGETKNGHFVIEMEKLINSYTQSNPLDCDINKSLSGGQIARLACAIRVYHMIKYNRDMMIFDEFDHGSDAEIAYQIVDNLIKKFPNKTLIFVSHLELISIVQKWDLILNINNGVISNGIAEINILEKIKHYKAL
jgi:ABC-type multidrug transport system fused ATPase/permease subunit